MAQEKKFVPFVSSETKMIEFTGRGLIIGLFLSIILGAANAYLGLKAGMTIAATYPAAVIGMALLRAMKGTILEENITRSVGSVGESVAAGAIFTLPAFFISGVWEKFFTPGHYVISSVIMVAGGVLGIMFVALLRRVMVSDAELPFPESVAAAEIHKTGQSGGGSKFLFSAMGLGALIKTLGEFKFFAESWQQFVHFARQSISGTSFVGKGGILLGGPGLKPAYLGVGYIIGPKLASLNFSGGVIAWGLLTPITLYFLHPYIDINQLSSELMDKYPDLTQTQATQRAWVDTAYDVWKFIVRPIAIGGMLVGTAYTLWGMRNSLVEGISRSIADLKEAMAGGQSNTERVEKDLSFLWIMVGVIFSAAVTFVITHFVFNAAVIVSLVATVVMIIAGFFFAAVSGYLVGIIGSSNNPISGLTISTVVVTAVLMLALGVHGEQGVASVLGVAAVVCVSAAVAGEMLQDLKAGHILGGTPWKMQIGDITGVVVSAAVLFIPLVILHQGDIAVGMQEGYDGGFGSKELPAPQASLMAILTNGIIAGEMAWPLIIVGMLMGVGFVLMQVKSPMLVAIGMYLPLETTFAIFIGGTIKGILQRFQRIRNVGQKRRDKMNNIGILLASGLIAGEALMGLLFAGLAFFEISLWGFEFESYLTSIVLFFVIGFVLIRVPFNASKKDIDVPDSGMPE